MKNTSIAAIPTARSSNTCRARLGGNWPRSSITPKNTPLAPSRPSNTTRRPRLRRQHQPSRLATGTHSASTKQIAAIAWRGAHSAAASTPAAITAVTSTGRPQAGNRFGRVCGVAAARDVPRRRWRCLRAKSAGGLAPGREGGDRHSPARKPASSDRATTESALRQSGGSTLRADGSSQPGNASPSISATTTFVPSSSPWSRSPSRKRGTIALSMMPGLEAHAAVLHGHQQQHAIIDTGAAQLPLLEHPLCIGFDALVANLVDHQHLQLRAGTRLQL
ncbi:hypothetical protein G6F22_015317 [Rhizopus arrhizus]|nr:hypothetical protein G6F22_015317 [Rhizopus arrhizus]